MKYLLGLLLSLLLMVQIFAQNNQPISASQTDPKAQVKILDQYGNLPLSFEANQDQTDARVKFLSRGAGYTLFLTSDEAVFSLRGNKSKDNASGDSRQLRRRPAVTITTNAVLRMKLRNANPAAKMTGFDELPGTSNYFIGNDPAKWSTNVPNYAKVKYEGIYPGIDLVYYGNQRRLEYDFVVAPGADPSRIHLKFGGAGTLRIGDKGDLLLGVEGEEVRLQKPQVYQEASGTRKAVEGHYSMEAAKTISFRVADYDRSKPLIIDPVLVYSTYLGGSNGDEGYGIAVDSAGNAYVTGFTQSTDFPTVNPIQSGLHGGANVFITKINASGTALVYSTYLGGSDDDQGRGIAVDSAGNAYVTGLTQSTDFPTVNAIQYSLGGNRQGEAQPFPYDAFVTKINASGTALVYSTYLGGSGVDGGSGIAVDSAGNAYVTGFTYSPDFPTVNAIQPNLASQAYFSADAFITKINASGTALAYSTYLGGAGFDTGDGIAVDSAGNAYVTGTTGSDNFPTVNAIQSNLGGGEDAFITKINASGTALLYSTFLGGTGDDLGVGIAVDSAGNAYVTGATGSTNFPTVNAIQSTLSSTTYNVFITKINASGTALLYSTYLGGGTEDVGEAIAVDSAGNAYVTGYTVSTNFPTVNAIQSSFCTNNTNPFDGTVFNYNVIVTRINASGTALVYSTYLGCADIGNGIAVDSAGNAYVTGDISSPDFPTVNAIQSTLAGPTNSFVAKIAGGPRYSVCLLYDPTKAVHSGATIPIKLQLCDSSGNDLSSSSITVHAISVTQISTSASGAVENAGNSNPDNDFRFDATLGSTGGYIFNLKTTGLSTGTYKVNFTVTGDSFVYAANFEVK